ncbi:RNA polymerase recycling motor ATPase HelR [Rhodococcus triatomae]
MHEQVRHRDNPTGPASAFALPERLAAKADPALISADELFFARLTESLDRSVADLTRRIDTALRSPGRLGREIAERDMAVHQLSAELRALRRFGLDLCLGHMVPADGSAPVYIGRLGLLDGAGEQLLVDWRSPAAEPFFGATHGNPMGLDRRRRYRWTGGRIHDYWDEVFTSDAGRDAALDDQSAFIASLGGDRSPRMRDVLGTIAADQDAVIRAGSRGTLVVDGGPGTGKTVVALHRAAYLLYSDRRLRHGVLFVGPHEPYLAYVADVLPSLGEEGVQLCTVRDLVAEGAGAPPETDPAVARLKSSADLVRAVDAAVRFYEQPPTGTTTVTTDWADIPLTAEDWAEAFGAPEPGTPHNEAREDIWELLLTILTDKADADIPRAQLRQSLQRNDELRAALDNTWTLIEAADLVADLWSVPAYLRLCAPWLAPDDVRALQRADAKAWTDADLPILDAARRRLGDPEASRRARRHRAAVAAERERRAAVVDDLIASDAHADGEGLMTQLRQHDLQELLIDEDAMPGLDPDLLAGPFAHIVVDEAQELTDAQWQMLLARCPSRSFTVVGDRAQARHGFTESWHRRLERVGMDRIDVATLTINYRTPEEVMAEAEPVIRAALPDANVPTSIRSNGIPVRHGHIGELRSVLDTWLAEHDEGTACVIGSGAGPFEPTPRIRWLTPTLAKGLEFDLVVLVEDETDAASDDIAFAVDRYVAMTRATRELVVLGA